MGAKDIISGFVLLILVYLLANNASGSSQVIEAIGGTVGNTTKALQGR